MQMTIATVTFLVGLSLVVIGIFGGGLEVKEVKIPTLPPIPRAMSFAVGSALLALCIFFPHFFPRAESAFAVASVPAPDRPSDKISSGPTATSSTAPSSANTKKDSPFLGAAIRNQLISVREIKVILRRLGTYQGPIDDEPSHYYFQAVADFQISQNLEADGYVGAATYSKLRAAWPEFFATPNLRSPSALPVTGVVVSPK